MPKMMERVAKLLALAEDQAGTPEGDLAMEQATKLSQAHAIDLHIARAHNAKKSEASKPEKRDHKVAASFWRNGRNESKANAPFVKLFLAIAHVYDLRCVISGGNTMVHAIGFPEDHEMAERLFSILSVQMVAEADALLKSNANKVKTRDIKRRRVEIPEDERDWGGYDSKGQQYDEDEGVPAIDGRTGFPRWGREHPPPSWRYEDVYDDEGNPVMVDKWVTVTDARVWRKNHYAGFSQGIRARLRKEKRQALIDAGIDPDEMESSEKGLALVDKKKQVEAAHEEEKQRWVLENGRELGSYEGTKAARSDYSAQAKGVESSQRVVTGAERDLREA